MEVACEGAAAAGGCGGLRLDRTAGAVAFVRPGGAEEAAYPVERLRGDGAGLRFFQASHEPGAAGLYRVEAELELQGAGLAAACRFRGSARLPVVRAEDRAALVLAGGVAAEVHGGNPEFLRLAFPASRPDRAHLKAEVHGCAAARGTACEERPVAWVAGIVDSGEAARGGGGGGGRPEHAFRLALHRQWLFRALGGPWGDEDDVEVRLRLRNVRLKDVDTQVIFAAAAAAEVRPAAGARGWLQAAVRRASATEDRALLELQMADGPGATLPELGSEADKVPDLGLTGGYCTTYTSWSLDQFTNAFPISFDKPIVASIDEFARRIIGICHGFGYKAYSLIGHSQGGLAALHMLTYYHTGLDHVHRGRKIQSVGSPYRGVALMHYEEKFAWFYCGYVPDLTPEGAAAWLRDIPTKKRKEVYYWRTTKAADKLLACNIATRPFLDQCNDGVVQCSDGVLEGGNDMGVQPGGFDPAHPHGCHCDECLMTEKVSACGRAGRGRGLTTQRQTTTTKSGTPRWTRRPRGGASSSSRLRRRGGGGREQQFWTGDGDALCEAGGRAVCAVSQLFLRQWSVRLGKPRGRRCAPPARNPQAHPPVCTCPTPPKRSP